MTKPYTVLIHKATREVTIDKQFDDYQTCQAYVDTLYNNYRTLLAAGVAATGVAIVIVNTDHINEYCDADTTEQRNAAKLYQAGCY